MSSSITRSSRSATNKKVIPTTTDNIISKTKSSSSSSAKRKRQRHGKKDNNTDLEARLKRSQQDQQQEQDNESLFNGKIDASEHPEYSRLMNQLSNSKSERLQKMETWQRFERQSIHDWFSAQKKQAWDDFYFARKKVRSDLVEEVQRKITRLQQELAQSNKQLKTQVSNVQECDEDWVPPGRLYSIGSFVAGATNEEIDRDLVFARQPYNGSNTPNLVYSDYESRSTTDTAEDGEATSPSRTEVGSSSSAISEPYASFEQHHQQRPILPPPSASLPHLYHHHQPIPSVATSTTAAATSNHIYPPYEFEELPQNGRRDWWSYRSTTIA